MDETPLAASAARAFPLSGTFAAPVFVVTAYADDRRAGCVVGFATEVSIHPARFLACISRQNATFPVAMRARVSVEAGITEPWKALVGDAGRSIGVNHYGASAAEAVLYKEFGITAEAVAAAAKASLATTKA